MSLEIGGLPTFGQRLAALEAGAPNGDASGLGANGGARIATKRQPTTASQVSLLVQALQNGDAAMLDEALQTQDAATITSTVARLPTNVVLPFLEAVLYRVQGKPARVASLASWLRALLAQHAAYLMACPTLLPMLTPLYQLIDERLESSDVWKAAMGSSCSAADRHVIRRLYDAPAARPSPPRPCPPLPTHPSLWPCSHSPTSMG